MNPDPMMVEEIAWSPDDPQAPILPLETEPTEIRKVQTAFLVILEYDARGFWATSDLDEVNTLDPDRIANFEDMHQGSHSVIKDVVRQEIVSAILQAMSPENA